MQRRGGGGRKSICGMELEAGGAGEEGLMDGVKEINGRQEGEHEVNGRKSKKKGD